MSLSGTASDYYMRRFLVSSGSASIFRSEVSGCPGFTISVSMEMFVTSEILAQGPLSHVTVCSSPANHRSSQSLITQPNQRDGEMKGTEWQRS